MPTPNYAYEKRQRELEKKRKKAEKAQRKTTEPSAFEPEPAHSPTNTSPKPPDGQS